MYMQLPEVQHGANGGNVVCNILELDWPIDQIDGNVPIGAMHVTVMLAIANGTLS